ncbi:hypothetical protein MPNT_680004 [Candidatus Methylacidithermus pantelleriae]|uniref:Uncharacterized protein n=1 Tax=Candidatus Methylacidithermus pantelleriae TaxID=2744239 RepID=A0A8J2BQP3_9BACT|nr:hypothetical protein MPNT_680004 [Candidatus Methylacidithermus pantelleriae]
MASAQELLLEIRKTIAKKADPVILRSPVGSVRSLICKPINTWEYWVYPPRLLLVETEREERIAEKGAIDGLLQPVPPGRKFPPEHSSLILSHSPRKSRSFLSSKVPGRSLPWIPAGGGDPSLQFDPALFPGLRAHRRAPKRNGCQKASTEEIPHNASLPLRDPTLPGFRPRQIFAAHALQNT